MRSCCYSLLYICDFIVRARLARQNEKIMNAHRTVAETEDVANEITEELGRNREKIESSHGKVIVKYCAF